MTSKDSKNWMDGLFEGKLDDRQVGYMWLKLSPKSRALIQKHLKIAELKARHDELRELPKSRWEGHEHCVGWDTVDDRLSELESQIKELSDENRGCPHCKPENFPKMMTGIYGCPCSCHASQEPSLNKKRSK